MGQFYIAGDNSEDKQLGEKVKKIHGQSRETYGARRIREELIENGESISRTRVGRLMKEQELESKSKRQFKATTDSNHERPVAPNRLNRAFQVNQPDRVYAGDITYIPTDEGWLYVAVLIDLYSRAVVGWAMSEGMKAPLVNDALTMAVWKRKPSRGLMVHSDRGSQYASELYQNTLKDHGFICSMSRKANCWDNGVPRTLQSGALREMRVRPLGIGLQGWIPNHAELLKSKALVVSVGEKAS